jgi:hypothetical protein
LFGSWFGCAQSVIFSAEPCSKNAGETSIVLWITARDKEFQHPAIQTKIEQHFSGFFHQMKCAPIGRQDSIQTVTQTSRRLDSFLHEGAQNFEVFSTIQE